MKTTRFPWFARVPSMKFFDETMSRDIGEWFPRIFRIGKTLPLDEIIEATLFAFGVQNIFDLKVFLIILDIERRRSGGRPCGARDVGLRGGRHRRRHGDAAA